MTEAARSYWLVACLGILFSATIGLLCFSIVIQQNWEEKFDRINGEIQDLKTRVQFQNNIPIEGKVI